MPLAANSRLGPYEIKSLLGAGGMGEVYRARDTRLNRDVAIKILRGEDASIPERRNRFEREARAVAALNHPNIVSVFDYGVEGDMQYIVSELVEGESLRRLVSKPVPVRKLVEIAAQVTDGLASAHAARVVHRDLKPENIMIGRDGHVKILDFGLSRQAHSDHPAETGINTETGVAEPDETKSLTEESTLLGTVNYMSPEQATGRVIDHRSDQFSLGLVLHEMATGKQTFARASIVETLAAIVRDEPTPIERKLPAPLRWIIDRCLQKEPGRRYESTRDLSQDLKNLREHLSDSYTDAATLTPQAKRTKILYWRLGALGGTCVLLAGLLGYFMKPTGPDFSNYRYTPIANNLSPFSTNDVHWSPDGKAVAYIGQQNGKTQVFLRYLNSPNPVQLTHEERFYSLIGWPGDGNHLIVWIYDRNKVPPYGLYSIAAVGGELEPIMSLSSNISNLTRDGKVYAQLSKNENGSYVVQVSEPLGSPMRPYLPAPFALKPWGPDLLFSPDGRSILLFNIDDNNRREIWLLPYPATGKPARQIFQKLTNSLIVEDEFSWMPDNRHLVLRAGQHLWMADTESGEFTPLTTGTESEYQPTVSPDGKSLLFTRIRTEERLVSLSVEDGSARTLIDAGSNESEADWSTNQAKLTFVTSRNGPKEIWIRMPDGSKRPVVTGADFPNVTNNRFNDPALSPEGDRLIYSSIDSGGARRLWISSLSGGSPIRLTTTKSGVELGGVWSPDGNHFVYLQREGSKYSLMTARTSGGVKPLLLKENVGPYLPAWSRSGEWITYRDATGWNLISPDGKISKFLANIRTFYLVFSKDGKLVYGIDVGVDFTALASPTLFSLDLSTLQRKDIKQLGNELQALQSPMKNRYSLAPDGKSFTYETVRTRNDLWMLQGYRQPGWFNRFSGALGSSK
jgi:serine/threonine protein kinase